MKRNTLELDKENEDINQKIAEEIKKSEFKSQLRYHAKVIEDLTGLNKDNATLGQKEKV